jgi:CRP-like cAMP-binding protein
MHGPSHSTARMMLFMIAPAKALLQSRVVSTSEKRTIPTNVGCHQPHPASNATVIAVTPCTLYKLHRTDLEVAMAMQPAIRTALEEESQKRIAMHYAG